MRDRHRTVMWSGAGTTWSTTRPAGTSGRRRLDTGQHELRDVHAMCSRALAAAIGCTEVAYEPLFHAYSQPTRLGAAQWASWTIPSQGCAGDRQGRAEAADRTPYSVLWRVCEVRQVRLA